MVDARSNRLAQIVAGKRRAHPLPTLAIAVAVTALVALPLLLRVLDDRPDVDPQANPDQITVASADGATRPLDGATLSGPALIAVDDADAQGASFQLFASGSDEPMLAAQDLHGPTFSPVLDAAGSDAVFDTSLLADGAYELFVVISKPGGEQRTAVVFEVANP